MPNVADFNHEHFSDTGASEADKQLLVKFYTKSCLSREEPVEGAAPVFVDREYIEIRVAGQKYPQVGRPATVQDKQRFSAHYQAFKSRLEQPEEGTPLKEWPQVTASQVDMLAYINVKTVEALANCADDNVAKIMGGNNLKARAKAFIEGQSSNESLMAENKAMAERLKKLEALMEKQTATPEVEPEPEPVVEVAEPVVELETVEPVEQTPTPRKRSRKK